MAHFEIASCNIETVFFCPKCLFGPQNHALHDCLSTIKPFTATQKLRYQKKCFQCSRGFCSEDCQCFLTYRAEPKVDQLC